MLTEEEARTKWCPFKRVPVSVEPGFGAHLAVAANVDGTYTKTLHGKDRCIGSACMAWRWVAHNELTEVVFAGSREGKAGTGYCGLAGSPNV